jgi:HK97 family phage major capsid protein
MRPGRDARKARRFFRFDFKGEPVPYDSIITRTDADGLVPDEQAAEIISAATKQSAALELCHHVPMSSKTRSMPVLSALPIAYWVNGDTGLKQTSEAAWAGLELTAEELAVIVPAPEALVNDVTFDLFGALRDPTAEAFAIKLDSAIFTGTDKPTSWPQAIIPAAQAAGNADTASATPAEGGIYAGASKRAGLQGGLMPARPTRPSNHFALGDTIEGWAPTRRVPKALAARPLPCLWAERLSAERIGSNAHWPLSAR